MNVDEMPAGRELDALVAERVMGWNLVYYRDDRLLGLSPGATVMWGENTAPYLLPVLSYSTNIAAAWEVVEYLAKSGIRLCIFDQLGYAVDEKTGDVTNDCLFRVEFMRVLAHERDELSEKIWCGVAEAVTAPLAICRAALKVMEGQKGQK